ncbi:MAG: VOC family protein [Lewinellaceae bacterium]|nr:VOC family protein [Lewinellaceae bacterium]MCB9289193.1 VOC family protein [Lewinellaceae bacterium]
MSGKQKITPYFWFDTQAEEAAGFYASIFPGSKIGKIQHQGDAVLTVQFFLSGQEFTALNGGPMFTFNPSVSFYVVCESEAEIDDAWAKLSGGGKALMPLNKYPWSEKYGWVQDKYGVSWQLTVGKISEVGQKISPVLMFTEKQHGKAEEAINFYTSLFEDSGIHHIARYEEGEGDPAVGTIKHGRFQLDGNIFMAMDSSYRHGFGFNEAISFEVHCKTQQEVDYFWEKLTADGGEEMMCAWLKDKYGLVWQIVPDELIRLIFDPDPGRAQRAVGAMMQMRKIDIEKVRRAADDDSNTVITVHATINAPVEKVWAMWTQPEHITKWNFASGDWHSPHAENNLRPGGKFSYRMEARDGSMGFDFSGAYTAVNENKNLEFTIDDGRHVQVHFSELDGGTFVMENFEAEKMNSIEMQRTGWQAILDNFKKYVEEN